MKNQKKKSFLRRVFLCLLAVLLAVCIRSIPFTSATTTRRPPAEERGGKKRFSCMSQENGRDFFIIPRTSTQYKWNFG